MKPVLTQADFARAADALSCDVRAIRAVCEVEAPKGGFLPDGRPTILFERHVFDRLTSGRWRELYPGVSDPAPGGYGAAGAWQHERLGLAASVDRAAALKSASWGKFQIMGFNHVMAGHAALQSFVNAMYESEGRQLDAFVAFILASSGLTRAIRTRDWATFARLYNGPNYAINRYDARLAAAYARAS